MIKHIVMWTLKEEAEGCTKKECAVRAKQLLEDLQQHIPQIVSIEVGINFNGSDFAYDLVLYSEFKSLEDLQIYQAHPKHLEAAAFIGSIVQSRAVCDYVR